MSLLKVENLSVVDTRNGERILNNISFSLESNSCLGIVGESGSGKSMTCKAILNLTNPWLDVRGNIYLHGEEIDRNNAKKIQEIRGKKIAMILQDAMTAFNPLYTIGYQMIETFCGNLKLSKRDAQTLGLEALDTIGIYDAKEVSKKYPHQLSGGMLQRCMIATALAMKPDMIIADEPTTALDAINQNVVVEQFELLQDVTGSAILFISHDLGVVQRLSQKVLVMKDGCCVEYGDADQIFRAPEKEYTRYLVETRRALSRPFHQIINAKEERYVKRAKCV
ncbi:ABC transporter ATP-binding protein [Geosporobacter ferrireducens]|uniref:ABC transporter ATP-binding protein n=1 Tax=Geosporobacter ferrireducens TaxID=1424294 RepID=UPI00139BF2DE|nr:ABC transporter ATP-binding protein [Geosporobacter ferrireducens]MTI55384.1 ABC transporter ATP-binding protein [Geosporobacter ferrireducens]